MKSFLKYCTFWLLTAAAFVLSAADAPLGNVRSNGIIEVKTPEYSLSFFPGCMFPFRLGTSGNAIQEPYWFDRLCGADGTWYFLRVERFAQREILSNTPTELKVRLTGHFCFDDDTTAPGMPRAIYTYTCTPEKISVSISLQNPEKKLWKEVHLLAPVWQRHSWKNRSADRAPASGEMVQAKEIVSVSNAQHSISLQSGAPTLFHNHVIPVTPVVTRDLFPAKTPRFTGLCAARLTDWSDAEYHLADLQLQIKKIK